MGRDCKDKRPDLLPAWRHRSVVALNEMGVRHSLVDDCNRAYADDQARNHDDCGCDDGTGQLFRDLQTGDDQGAILFGQLMVDGRVKSLMFVLLNETYAL